MQATLIENNGTGRIAYDSLILDNPKSFSALNSKLALKIVKSLAESPASAIDISRKLKIHEQKIYYHVRRLERAGIIYTISNEKRHGMIAKIFSVVSPVIAAKLYDKGVEVKDSGKINLFSQDVYSFFEPFITEGKLNAKIVLGDTYPHGKYDGSATEGPHITDFMLFLGNILTQLDFPHYTLDTEVKSNDLTNNLILVGNPKTNVIIDKVNNENLPIFFDKEKGLVSKHTSKVYDDARVGVIMKMKNPFNPDKCLLLIGGIRSRGVKAAMIAMTQHINSICTGFKKDYGAKIIQGLDRDGDSIIESIKILE